MAGKKAKDKGKLNAIRYEAVGLPYLPGDKVEVMVWGLKWVPAKVVSVSAVWSRKNKPYCLKFTVSCVSRRYGHDTIHGVDEKDIRPIQQPSKNKSKESAAK